MKITTAILLVVFAFIIEASAQKNQRSEKAKQEIRTVLDTQVAAWNRGSIDEFMKGYWNSPETTFSGKTLTRGWQTVLDNYKRNYSTPEKMGVLNFSNLEINVLSKDSAFVLGNWELKRTNDDPKGAFTLVFRKTKDGWRIVHDHTS
jgi:ketosteroid isomerase-like protein